MAALPAKALALLCLPHLHTVSSTSSSSSRVGAAPADKALVSQHTSSSSSRGTAMQNAGVGMVVHHQATSTCSIALTTTADRGTRCTRAPTDRDQACHSCSGHLMSRLQLVEPKTGLPTYNSSSSVLRSGCCRNRMLLALRLLLPMQTGARRQQHKQK